MVAEAAFSRSAPLSELYKAATQTKPLMFVQHHTLDAHTRADVPFQYAALKYYSTDAPIPASRQVSLLTYTLQCDEQTTK